MPVGAEAQGLLAAKATDMGANGGAVEDLSGMGLAGEAVAWLEEKACAPDFVKEPAVLPEVLSDELRALLAREVAKIQQQGECMREAALACVTERLAKLEALQPQMEHRLQEFGNCCRGVAEELREHVRWAQRTDDRLWKLRRQLDASCAAAATTTKSLQCHVARLERLEETVSEHRTASSRSCSAPPTLRGSDPSRGGGACHRCQVSTGTSLSMPPLPVKATPKEMQEPKIDPSNAASVTKESAKEMDAPKIDPSHATAATKEPARQSEQPKSDEPVPKTQDLKVPRPPLRSIGSMAGAKSGPCGGGASPSANAEGRRRGSKDFRAPNVALALAMAGQTADWGRIRKMAERIRDPKYILREFFDDCVQSFPELSLFFASSDSGPAEGQTQASSGLSGEVEYQRTIGALFTVYWVLRLEGDGMAGFCNGVDECWHQIPLRPPVEGKPVASTSSEEKRAKFAATMDWQLFKDLVARAGCAPGAPGSTDRIMALLCLSAFHDIMKLPMLQPIVQPEHAPYNGYEAGVRIHDHDTALGYVLECFPSLLPSYAGLPDSEKRRVLFTQGKMQFNHGWFVQAEAPPGGMLSKFKTVLEGGADQEDIDLYFLHWITDLAGAEATPLGGAEKLVTKFPTAVLVSFLWSMTYLSRLVGMSETALVEEYLEARWKVLLPEVPVPKDPSAIAKMRLVLMAQAEDSGRVLQAFKSLSASDQACLVAELSRTACAGQSFTRNAVRGGPAFLVYYGPALLQRNNTSQAGLKAALRILCAVFRGARAVWPTNLSHEGNTVIIQIGELKRRDLHEIYQEGVWVLLRNNDNEGVVSLRSPCVINALYMEDARFRLMDFSAEPVVDPAVSMRAMTAPSLPKVTVSDEPLTRRASLISEDAFNSGKRILVFMDMSTECDDECAFLWLLSALHRRGQPAVVELVQGDSHVRFQWMAHVFSEKFAPGGEWKLQEGGSSFLFKNVLVNMYLAHSPDREEQTINDMLKKAPDMDLDVEIVDGRKTAVRAVGEIGGLDYDEIRGGPLSSIVVSAAIPAVNPEFFRRFSSCKCVYVAGTPGGINCPMPSWVDHLAVFHRFAPVLYLTPQFTRTVRFPRSYVLSNEYWNDIMKYKVWDSVLTCMARRPELPPTFGTWGLVLRLNNANAVFCRDWHVDALGTRVEEAERPKDLVRSVEAYVDRNSGDDRRLGTIVDELKFMGVGVSPAALGLRNSDFNSKGEPVTPAAIEAVRQLYRRELFETTMLCLLTADALIWKNKKNVKAGQDAGGFEKLQPRCGYTSPDENLADVFGVDDAISILKTLPLRWLTPAYDVVAMICANCALEDGTEVDGGLDLLMDHADETMGLGMLSQEQQALSEHPILYTLPQAGHGVYAAGPFS